MIQDSTGSIDALVPRGLISTNVKDIEHSEVTKEGLCSLHIRWENGKISSIESLELLHNQDLKLLLPRLVEPHTHIDKAFTWLKAPNLAGTYSEALAVNLREHNTRPLNKILQSVDNSLNLALRNGIRSIRSHIDIFGSSAENTWESLLEVRSKWAALIDLQMVALAPLTFWNNERGHHLASKCALFNGLLGGVIVPPFKNKEVEDELRQMLTLAENKGCGVDLHIDESEIYPAAGLRILLKILDQMKLNIPITCSHISSLGLLRINQIKYIADQLARHQVNVISLPLTNAWLLGRKTFSTPIIRPIAPISQLQYAGVKVAIGGDNVKDSWFPLGNLDPLSLMGFCLPLTQLAPWHRLGLSPFTTSAAKVLNLSWDGIIRPGSPADFILLDARSWSEALAKPPQREVLIAGEWLGDQKITK